MPLVHKNVVVVDLARCFLLDKDEELMLANISGLFEQCLLDLLDEK